MLRERGFACEISVVIYIPPSRLFIGSLILYFWLKSYQLRKVVDFRLKESVDIECYSGDNHRQEVLEQAPPVG